MMRALTSDGLSADENTVNVVFRSKARNEVSQSALLRAALVLIESEALGQIRAL